MFNCLYPIQSTGQRNAMKRLLAVAMLLGCTAVQAAERQNAERVNQEVTCGEYGKLVEEVGKEQTLSGKRVILPEAINRIWGNEGYKVFLSHKTEVKKETAALKEELKLYGISCFVAHKDIHPTKEWQNEIENALSSMDSLIALLTDKFHDSIWTDQEVGFAFGCGIPIIPVKLGIDPYGFIGKFQALSCSWDTAATEIVKILLKHERMVNAYIKAVQNCENYENGNILAKMLVSIDKLSSQQTSDLLSAFNGNRQVQDSFGFNGRKPQYYGDGLVYHLNRLSNQAYRFSRSGKIEIAP